MQSVLDERAAVLNSLERLSSAIYGQQLQAVLALFAPGPDTLLISSEAGEVARGPYELQALFERMFARAVRYSYRWEVTVISLYGDVATIYASGVIVTTSEAGLHEHPYRMTGVLLRSGSEWLWAHYHGSEPAG